MVRGTVAGLATAVLAPVQQMNLQQIANLAAVEQTQLGAMGARQAGPQWHMFVEGLIGGGTAASEAGGIIKALRPVASIVVLHLMVIPRQQAGCRGVQRLQIWIKAILGMAAAILRQGRCRNAIAMLAYNIT